jgi:DNA polymerase-3 subunit alpha
MDGDVAFRIREDGSIDFGLGFIRHVGAQAAKEALKMKGCFTNLTMFLAKTSTRILNERAIKSMIAGGAFDFTGLTRNILFEKHQAVGELVHKYKDQQKRKKEGVKLKTELTLEEIAVIESGVTVRQHPFTMEQLLDMEHEVLGAFISQSPTAPFEHIIREKTNTDIFDIMEGNMLGKDLCFAARINDIRTHIVKNGDNAGKEMAFVNVSYHSCDVDAMVFTATYAKLKQVLKIGKIYIFRGESERRAFLSITDAELLSQT